MKINPGIINAAHRFGGGGGGEVIAALRAAFAKGAQQHYDGLHRAVGGVINADAVPLFISYDLGSNHIVDSIAGRRKDHIVTCRMILQPSTGTVLDPQQIGAGESVGEAAPSLSSAQLRQHRALVAAISALHGTSFADAPTPLDPVASLYEPAHTATMQQALNRITRELNPNKMTTGDISRFLLDPGMFVGEMELDAAGVPTRARVALRDQNSAHGTTYASGRPGAEKIPVVLLRPVPEGDMLILSHGATQTLSARQRIGLAALMTLQCETRAALLDASPYLLDLAHNRGMGPLLDSLETLARAAETTVTAHLVEQGGAYVFAKNATASPIATVQFEMPAMPELIFVGAFTYNVTAGSLPTEVSSALAFATQAVADNTNSMAQLRAAQSTPRTLLATLTNWWRQLRE